ncbi:MAG: hypothetical protein ACP5HM_03795 [Anaerolineae bacterium]
MRKRFDVREWLQPVWEEAVSFLHSLYALLWDLPHVTTWFARAVLFYLSCLILLAVLQVERSLALQIALIITLSLLSIDFVNFRERFRLWKRVAHHWWRWSEDWPLTSVLVFVKALPLLGLWLLIAYVVYTLLEKATGQSSTALIGTLITTLAGFGIQQWKIISSGEEERKKHLRDARNEIEEWRRLLQDDYSKGARRYLSLLRRNDGVWKKERIQSGLKEAWQTTAPADLRDAVRLLACVDEAERFKKIAGEMEESRPAHVLEWTLENLDDDWRQKAWPGFLSLSDLPAYAIHIDGRRLQQAQQRQWVQILRCSPQISLWHRLPPTPDTALASGLRYVGLHVPPFGNAVAETDSALLKTRISPNWWKDIRLFETALYTGDKGAGKTATALWIARDALTADRSVFPVYWRGTPVQLQFETLSRSLAYTLLHYLAVTPEDFLKSSIDKKASMAHLLGRYFTPRLTYHFRRAGVPEVGEGAQMVQEIETLAQSAPTDAPLSENELLILLRQARPRPFEATLMLLDVQSTPQDPRLWGRRLSIWCEKLGHAGVFIKVFMPPVQASAMTMLTESLDIPHYDLTLSPAKLKAILEQRLKHSGESALREWCDPVIRPSLPDLEAWIVHAAEGKLGRMFQLGNDLIRRIGQKQALLNMDDLIDILGDPPEETAA